MKKIDYKTAYETLYMAYEMLLDEITKLQHEMEILKGANEEHRVLNGKLKEELEFEKATNKELLSTGADLENKLYEEQDKNKRLNNIINKLDTLIEQYSKNDYYFKYNGKYLKSEIINDLKELKGSDKE